MIETIGNIGADGITIAVAFMCVLWRCIQSWWKKSPVNTQICVMSLLNGASLFPFILMVGAAYSTELLKIAAASKLSVSIAGAVGLMFVLGEVISPDSLKGISRAIGKPAANDDNAAIFLVAETVVGGLSDANREALRAARESKKVPKEIDGVLLARCRDRLSRDLKHPERAAVRARLLEIA